MRNLSSPAARSIRDVALDLGLVGGDLYCYGDEIAKVGLGILARERTRPAQPRLVLVSAITPTPAGEGKTTTSIGLADGLRRLGHSVCLALREPSLGPCLGMKGGATGGGAATLVPTNRINLHFTGDFHAITSAHNLLAAMLDNHIYFGNRLGIDPRRTLWRRVIDMNDRSLRNTIVGLGGPLQGVPRETGFDITAASEIMAMFCLASGPDDLRARIDRTLVGFTYEKVPVTASQLKATGAMLALLNDAIKPNLVQTAEGTPAFVHGGPFGNIAHGCNSVLATKLALHCADWTITEAGFGFDLGAEKFFDIKCVSAGLDTAAVVLVATIRALKMHGGTALTGLTKPDPTAVQRGLGNLEKHIENIGHFGEPPIVALNRFGNDSDEEIDVVRRRCEDMAVPFAVADHFAHGGAGTLDLARTVLARAEPQRRRFRPLYSWSQSVVEKIEAVARKMYGATNVILTKQAESELAEIERLGYSGLPVCIAKTQNSLSDDPKLRGRPRDFDVTVRSIQINAGAGFLVVLTGDILRMPGLPQQPRAEVIDVVAGEVKNLR